MSYLRGLALLIAVALVSVAAPAVTASAAGPVPSPARTGAAPSLVVESPGSVSLYRYARGLHVQAFDLPTDLSTVELRLDGSRVRDLTVLFGGVDEYATLPGITVGTHVVELASDGEAIVSETIEVTADPFQVSASPAWITAELLESDGVTLSATGLAPDVEVIAFMGDNAAEGRVGTDGRVSVTVRNDGDEFISEPGLHPAGLVLADDRSQLAYTEVRVTVLDATTRAGGSEIVGTGFEPGTLVTLAIDGLTVSTSGSADEAGTVVLPSPVSGSQLVTLSSPAGSVARTLTLDESGPETPGLSEEELAQLNQELEQTVKVIEAIERNQVSITQAISATAPTRRGTLALPEGVIERQAELQQQLVGDFPTPGLQKPKPGEKVVIDAGAAEKKLEQQVDDATSRYEQQADDLQKEISDAMAELLKQIIDFLREMQRSYDTVDRAIVRMSVPELLSVGPRPTGTLSIDVPTSFRGLHHLAAIDPTSGLVTLWQPFEVAAGSGASTSSGVLPGTGAPVGLGLVGLAAAVALGGAVLLRSGRRLTD